MISFRNRLYSKTGLKNKSKAGFKYLTVLVTESRRRPLLELKPVNYVIVGIRKEKVGNIEKY